MKDIYKYIGEELRLLRVKSKLSQEEVTKRIGYKSKNSISLFELGGTKIDLETLEKLCDLYGVDMIELLEKAKHERDKGQTAKHMDGQIL